MKKTLNDALIELREDAAPEDSIALDHQIPAHPEKCMSMPQWVDPRIKKGLAARGIEKLYSHQSQALNALQAGRNVVLATPTASGKSLCFHLPVFQEIAQTPASRALFLFPTKALGQDQVASLLKTSELAQIPLKVHTFDGDTPSSVRGTVRKEAQIVVTNPDMLHQGILPHHPSWMSFFRNLRYIVLDELHTYRGVFGSHVGNVLRRLHRICSFYGANPKFIASSATIANPGELAQKLTRRDFEVIAESGAPTGKKHLIITKPPIVNKALGIRRSYILFAREMLRPFLHAKVPTIVFGLSRLNIEVLLKYIREDLKKMRMDPELAQGYRGGYLPLTRRKIEEGLRSGKVRFVVSTSALELGIDIGSLQACFVVGYPGSIASLWQQAGRAGRREGESAVVFIPRSNPLDQYVATEPGFLLGASPEHARIDPDNLVILSEHIKCAAFELPFDVDEEYGGLDRENTEDLLETLASYRVLHKAGKRYHWSERTYPANQVSLRSIPGDNFVVIDQDHDKLLAEVDFKSAHTTLYEGAIYNLQAEQYEVLHLDYEGHKAFVKKVKPDYYTDAMTYVETRPIEVNHARSEAGYKIENGDVKVTEKVIGYKKIRFNTNENVGYGEVNLPEINMHTHGVWVVLPKEALRRHTTAAAIRSAQREEPISAEELALDVLAGLSHGLHHMAAISLMCDPRDLGRCIGDRSEQWFASLTKTNQSSVLKTGQGKRSVDPFAFDAAIFIYDRYPGGVGLSSQLDASIPQLLRQVEKLIGSCECSGGCPSCLGAFAAPSQALKEATRDFLSSMNQAPSLHREDAA